MLSLPRVSAYIDGANLFHAGNDIEFRIDYLKFKYIITENRIKVDLNFYDCWKGLLGEGDFFSKLASFGYCLKLVRLRQYGTEQPHEKKIDTQIVADSLYDACYDKFDIAVFGSGDKDILPAVEYLLKMDKQVEIMAFQHSLAWDLRNSGAHVIDLTKMREQICRRRGFGDKQASASRP